MAIDLEAARRAAHLARIEVEEADLPAIASELSSIVEFMERLNEVDVEGVEPTSTVTPMELKRRKDDVHRAADQAAILSNAPEARHGFFAVPKVVE